MSVRSPPSRRRQGAPKFSRRSQAEISRRPCQVTGWPIALNRACGYPTTASRTSAAIAKARFSAGSKGERVGM